MDISTLGSITPALSFERLFWKFFEQIENKKVPDILSALDTQVTYLFELCCAENRVLTEYTEDRLLLIGARNRKTGEVYQREYLTKIASQLRVEQPIYYPMASLGLKDLASVEKWIEEEARKENQYGKTPEGFVVLRDGIPIAKMKNNKYLDKHGLLLGNILYNRNIAIDRYFQGSLDDVQDVFSPDIHEFINELRGKVQKKTEDLREQVENFIATVGRETLSNPKTYAEKVNALVGTDKPLKGILFQHRAQLAQNQEDIGSLCLKWLKANYTSYNSFWKDTSIAAILAEEKKQKLNNK